MPDPIWRRPAALLLVLLSFAACSGASAPSTVHLPDTSGDVPTRGPADAPVLIEQFSDFQCPYCARAAGTMVDLLTLFPTQVRLVYRHFPLPYHPQAALAARAAVAAERQGRFWDFHDVLYFEASDMSREALLEIAARLGLDRSRFEADLDDPEVAARVEADILRGRAAGVQGVPHFVVGDRPVRGAQPLSAFRAVVEDELRTATDR